jgi:hypothetical protein
MEVKVYGVQRIEGRQNSGRQHHAARAEDPDRDKPRMHDPAENVADEASSSALNEEKYDQLGPGPSVAQISISIPISTTCAAGIPKYAADLSALRCMKA